MSAEESSTDESASAVKKVFNVEVSEMMLLLLLLLSPKEAEQEMERPAWLHGG